MTNNLNGLSIVIITQGISRIVLPLVNSSYKVVGVIESSARDFEKRGLVYRSLHFARRSFPFFSKINSSLKVFCKNRNIPYRFMWKSNDSGMIDWLSDIQPDVIVVYSMSHLLKESIFSIPRLGTINLHPSMLPRYRGPNPDFWHYYNMENSAAATVHFVDKGEDTGDIIFQEEISIPMGIRSPERLDLVVGKLGVSLILKALSSIANGTVSVTKQPLTSPTVRARNINREEHEMIIDWNNWSIERIWHLLRGTETWLKAIPQPRGFWRGQNWIIGEYSKAIILPKKSGHVVNFENQYVLVCKDGIIYLTKDFQMKNLLVGLISSG